MNAPVKTLLAAVVTVGLVSSAGAPAFAGGGGVVVTASCDDYATNYANLHVGPRFRGVIFGGLAGAGWGALIGAAFGAPWIGAAVGAGVGTATGAAIGHPNWAGAYNAAFSACMQGYTLP